MDEDRTAQREAFEAMVKERYLRTGATEAEFDEVKDELLREARKRAALNPASTATTGQKDDGGTRAGNARRYR